MRIDAPSSSLAVMSGSFSGHFTGKAENFVDVDLNNTLDLVSSSIDSNIKLVSSSIDSNISIVSASINESMVLSSDTLNTRITDVELDLTSSIVHTGEVIISTITRVSESIGASLFNVSESISASLFSISESISSSLFNVSRSIDENILIVSGTCRDTDNSLQTQIDTKVPFTNFNLYIASAVNTFYQDGDSIDVNNAIIEGDVTVKGSTLLKGDLLVSGTVTTVNKKDVIISDKFVEIASGSTTAQEADGAGFGIQGANVTASYDSATDSMTLNKNVYIREGEGTIYSNTVGNLEGTASFASDLDKDGVLAVALIDLKNMVSLQVTNSISPVNVGETSSEVWLYAGGTKSFQTLTITSSMSQIQLRMPNAVTGIDHFLLIKNNSASDCNILPPTGCLSPVCVITGHLDGGYAASLISDVNYTCYAGKSLGLEYVLVSGSGGFITHVTEMV